MIIFSDSVNDLWDVQRALEQVKKFCTPHTRLLLNFYSHVWQLPLTIAQSLNLAAPMLNQNWLTPEDVDNMLRLAGFESIRPMREVLWPLPLGGLADRYLVKLWPFRDFALSNFVIARPAATPAKNPSVSVIVAARNVAVPDRHELTPRAEDIELRWGLPARKWLRMVRPLDPAELTHE